MLVFTQTTLPHVTMHRLRTSCMAAVAHPSPLRPCTHPVRHRCLLYAHYTPPCGHVHTPYLMHGCGGTFPLPSNTIYTPHTPCMLAVRTLRAPMWPCTDPVRPRCLLYAHYTPPCDHVQTHYAITPFMLAVALIVSFLRSCTLPCDSMYTDSLLHVWMRWHISTPL